MCGIRACRPRVVGLRTVRENDGDRSGAATHVGCSRETISTRTMMPLSDEEQKILREIEAQLNATDPGLVEQVSRTTLYRHSARVIRWAALGLLGGLILLVFTFASSVWVGAIGFGIMLACSLVIERPARK